MPDEEDKIDLHSLPPEEIVMQQHMLNDALIVLIQRYGGAVDIGIGELDTMPVGKMLSYSLNADRKSLHFEVHELHEAEEKRQGG